MVESWLLNKPMLICYYYSKSSPIPGSHWRCPTAVGCILRSPYMTWFEGIPCWLRPWGCLWPMVICSESEALGNFHDKACIKCAWRDHRGRHAIFFMACWQYFRGSAWSLRKHFYLQTTKASRGDHCSKLALVRFDKIKSLQGRSFQI